MAKARGWRNRATGKVDKTVTATKDTEFCQQCKTHSNQPSTCTLMGRPTGRKETCKNFKRR